MSTFGKGLVGFLVARPLIAILMRQRWWESCC